MNNQRTDYAKVIKKALWGGGENAMACSLSEKHAVTLSRQLENVIVDQDKYGVHLTDTAEGSNSASTFVNRMYSWRNYAAIHMPGDAANRIILVANAHGEVFSTLTIGFDSPIRLVAIGKRPFARAAARA